MSFFKKIPIHIVEFFKTLGFRTWHVEAFFVALVLVAISIISKKGMIEWIGTVAVFITFLYSSIADRLQEAEQLRAHAHESIVVECHKKLPVYFYLKESLWLVYFFLLGAWSALAGVFIFIGYGWWRKYWRKYHPLKNKLT